MLNTGDSHSRLKEISDKRINDQLVVLNPKNYEEVYNKMISKDDNGSIRVRVNKVLQESKSEFVNPTLGSKGDLKKNAIKVQNGPSVYSKTTLPNQASGGGTRSNSSNMSGNASKKDSGSSKINKVKMPTMYRPINPNNKTRQNPLHLNQTQHIGRGHNNTTLSTPANVRKTIGDTTVTSGKGYVPGSVKISINSVSPHPRDHAISHFQTA